MELFEFIYAYLFPRVRKGGYRLAKRAKCTTQFYRKSFHFLGLSNSEASRRLRSGYFCGKAITKVVPFPCSLLSVIDPPWALKICWTIESPIPVPSGLVVKNGSKISMPAGIPVPVSEISRMILFSEAEPLIEILPPPAIASAAFLVRLKITCFILLMSTVMVGRFDGKEHSTWIPNSA